MARKVDLKKELKHLYGPSAKEVSVVDVPHMIFLMIDGEGRPPTPHQSTPMLLRHSTPSPTP